MPDNDIMHGPFEVEIKVHMRCGENTAVATYVLPVGVYPTREDVDRALVTSLSSVKSQLGEGDVVRLLNRREFQNEMLAEKIGHYVDFAAPDDWDK